MKVLILAGGLGTRLGEETSIKPKPMVEIGEYPILWHIMKYYSCYGFNDFIILAGYKQEVIKDYFFKYYIHNSDVTFDLLSNAYTFDKPCVEPWKVSIVNTGKDSLTGSRIKKVKKYINDEPFLLTYGDGLSDVNLRELIQFHMKEKKLCTLTAYQPSGRFGALDISESGEVLSFNEKPKQGGKWINSGFFVCEPEVFDYIPDGESVIFEDIPLKLLTKAKELNAFKHYGFWHPMDMLKDKKDLNLLWESGKAPWKIW